MSSTQPPPSTPREPPTADGFVRAVLASRLLTRDRLDAVLAEAAAAGATILKPAQDVFWGGYSGYFADPDGHLWEVAWNPEWTLTEDGEVRLGKS